MLALLLALAAAGAALAGPAGWLAAVLAGLGALCALAALLDLNGSLAEIERTTRALDALSRGDFAVRVIRIAPGPVGRLMLAANAFADRADAFLRESRASLEAVTAQRYHRRIIERGLVGDFLATGRAINAASGDMAAKVAELRRATAQFEASVSAVAGGVATASGGLASAAGVSSSAAEAVTRDAMAVGAAAEEASTNVQTVAAAADQLSASIREISGQVTRSRDLATAAVQRAAATDADVQQLNDAAARIGEIVDLIRSIAAQTNLLALNATIEAARAGEAGKGFAVVATEVKNLATQTAQATEGIVQQVAAIQAAASGAVAAIGGIAGAIGDVNENMVVVAAAVEQQGAATQEIARNVEQASAGTGEVSRRIAEVTQSARRTGEASTQVHAAAADLAKQSERLRGDIEGFLVALRKVV
ncbi:MAG: methyl-accepting chemotaxis protein [Thalassobaculales bacterium]